MTRRDGQGDDPAIVMPTGLEFNPIQDGLFRGCSRMGGRHPPHIPYNDEAWHSYTFEKEGL